MKGKLLVVEDNSRYWEAAQRYLEGRQIVVERARDYREAMFELSQADPEKNIADSIYSGAFIDCFFPEETGSGKRNLGKLAIVTMAESDPREYGLELCLDGLRDYVDVDDPEARAILKAVFSSMDSAELTENSTYKAILQVGKTLGKEANTTVSVKTGALPLLAKKSQYIDHFQALRDGVEESEDKAPLGILVAEEAGKVRVPFVLTTSTHHHGAGTQAVQNYASRQGWTLVDCPPEDPGRKAKESFWDKAYRVLIRGNG